MITRLISTLPVNAHCRFRTMVSVAKVVRMRKPPTSASVMPAAARSWFTPSTSSLRSSEAMMVGMKPVTSAWVPSSVTKRRLRKGPTASNISSRVNPESE